MRFWPSLARPEKALVVLFFLTLPFVRPSVFSDGIGYYAYLRSPLVDHNLQFVRDWQNPPNEMLRLCTVCPREAKQYWNHRANRLLFVYLNGRIYYNPITQAGHLPNYYTTGPAILWLPFVGAAHVAVLVTHHFGAQIKPDGDSWPYIVALSGATALYGFLGLWLSFQLAKKYVEERWAFWATLGIWFASSLPTTMYLQPSWSHTHSAFCVALFLWYWDRTRACRTWQQWAVLGLISGLMADVYLANAVFLLAPSLDCVEAYLRSWREPHLLWKNVRLHLLFAAGCVVAFSPMLITRAIVYGNPLALGMYANVSWNWKSPALWAVLFSSGHGIFVCTPILLLAVLGLFALCRVDLKLGASCLLMTAALYCLISVYPWWHGVYSFGNRFFIALTPVFVIGLAAAFSQAARLWPGPQAAARRLVPVTVLLIIWNFGLIYQFTHVLFFPESARAVSWTEVVYNQFRVVPGDALREVSAKVSAFLTL
jgi:hypothetical protein